MGDATASLATSLVDALPLGARLGASFRNTGTEADVFVVGVAAASGEPIDPPKLAIDAGAKDGTKAAAPAFSGGCAAALCSVGSGFPDVADAARRRSSSCFSVAASAFNCRMRSASSRLALRSAATALSNDAFASAWIDMSSRQCATSARMASAICSAEASDAPPPPLEVPGFGLDPNPELRCGVAAYSMAPATFCCCCCCIAAAYDGGGGGGARLLVCIGLVWWCW